MAVTLLAGDIGGTKTILRLLRSEGLNSRESVPVQTSLYERTYPSGEFADLVPMVHQFLRASAAASNSIPSIQTACFGIAGPVINQTSDLTNLSWSLSAERLQAELKIPQVILINDFVANGYGVLGLSGTDLVTLQAGQPDRRAPIAVIGAGTGLGHGFLTPCPDGRYQVFPSEGGHTDFIPRSALEFQLVAYLKERHNWLRVSAERVVSGAGIALIYEFLRHLDPEAESQPLAALYQTWSQELGKAEKTVDLPAEIAKAAREERDYLCQQAMKLFVEAYGAEAGNFALKLLPYGGLYIAGGVAAKNVPLLKAGNFLTAFKSKGRLTSLMSQIPVHIVTNPQLGLIGAGLRAALPPAS